MYVNVSPYLIKPEAYACCGAIRARLEDAGLRIVFHKPYRLSAPNDAPPAPKMANPPAPGRSVYLTDQDLA